MKDVIIYLAHSKGDYGNDYINQIANMVINEFRKHGLRCIILDPSKVYVKENEKTSSEYYQVMVKYFYPMIDKSDTVVAIADSKTGEFSSGVTTEIRYAKSINRNIIKV